MLAVDTNVLVRIIIGDNPRQTAVADQFIENSAWVPVLAVAEATWVLRAIYKQSHADIAAALGLYKSHPALGFSDCLILHLARKAGHLPLGTFDRALGRVEGVRKL
jgi:predicted nucleic acid-binding protein